MQVLVNSVWHLNADGPYEPGQWRIISLCPQLDLFIWVQFSPEKRFVRPCWVEIDVLSGMIESGEATVSHIDLPPYQLKDEKDIHPDHRLIRDARFEVIEGAVKDDVVAIDLALNKRSRQLSDYAKACKVHRVVLSRYLNLYWQYGQQKNALLPAFSNCGAPGKIRIPNKKKRGRPKVQKFDAFPRAEGVNIGEMERQRILAALKKDFLNPKPKKRKKIYDEFIDKHYAEEVLRAEIAGVEPNVPSRDQFYNWSRTLLSDFEVIKKQHSEKDFLLEKRALLSSATIHTPLPGSCFEIDATVSDVHLVSCENENHCIGRATVYALIDKASRMIVGIYIGLEHEGWAAARQALMNCILPKKDYCARYGIEIDEEDWPCCHLPLALLGDRGGILAKALEEACIPNLTIDITATNRADLKGIVEAGFRKYKEKFWDEAPGSTLGKPLKRRDRDPKLDATFTLKDFTQIMIEQVLEHNNRSQLAELALNPLIVENDLEPTPINFWNIHIQKHLHGLRAIPEIEARAMLLEPVEAAVTGKGIEYNGMLYLCDQAIEEGWFVEARAKKRVKIEARICLDDTSQFYVRRDAKSPFLKCRMKSHMKIYNGRSMADVIYLREWGKHKKRTNEFKVEDIQRRRRIKDVYKQAAINQGKAPPNKTKKEKGANIKERRRAELEMDTSAKTTALKTDDNINETAEVVRLEVERRSRDDEMTDLIFELVDSQKGESDE